MKPTLQSGIAAKRSFHVGRDSTIAFMGEDSLGTRVEIEHLAPTLEGADVQKKRS